MPVSAVVPRLPRSPNARRGVIATTVIGIAAAVAVATWSSPRLAHALDEGVSRSLHGVQTWRRCSPSDRRENGQRAHSRN